MGALARVNTHESSADDPASKHEAEMKQMRRDEEETAMEQKGKYKKENRTLLMRER